TRFGVGPYVGAADPPTIDKPRELVPGLNPTVPLGAGAFQASLVRLGRIDAIKAEAAPFQLDGVGSKHNCHPTYVGRRRCCTSKHGSHQDPNEKGCQPLETTHPEKAPHLSFYHLLVSYAGYVS